MKKMLQTIFVLLSLLGIGINNTMGVVPGLEENGIFPVMYSLQEEEIPCETPTAIVFSDTTHYSIWVDWTAGSNETAWIVKYKEEGSTSAYQIDTVMIKPVLLSGLLSETTYDIRITTLCDEETESTPLVAVFETLPYSCDAPAILFIDTTSNGVTIDWTPGGNETTWVLEYRKYGTSDSYTIDTITVKPVEIDNLESNVHYEIRVKSLCPENLESEYLEDSFYTSSSVLPGCPRVENLTIDSITHSSATLYWSPAGVEDTWIITCEYLSYSGGWIIHSRDTVQTLSHTLFGLSPMFRYCVSVAVLCDTAIEVPVFELFTTLPIPFCASPMSLNFLDVTGNSAIIRWDSQGDNVQWRISYREINSLGGIQTVVTFDTTVMEVQIANLDELTFYEVCVSAVCASDVLSDTVCSILGTTSTKMHSVEKQVWIYPNPVHNTLHVQTEEQFERIEIVNMLGQSVYTSLVSEQHIDIDTDNLESGFYFLRLCNKKGALTRKFIKE